MLGSSIILMGVIASMISGCILNKWHNYVMMVRISAWGSFIFVCIAMGCYYTEDPLIVSIFMIIAATCLIPIISISIDFATEMTFPIEETVCTGFMLMSA
jgi:hydrogenase-4 membrane subunit HyfE